MIDKNSDTDLTATYSVGGAIYFHVLHHLFDSLQHKYDI